MLLSRQFVTVCQARYFTGFRYLTKQAVNEFMRERRPGFFTLRFCNSDVRNLVVTVKHPDHHLVPVPLAPLQKSVEPPPFRGPRP